MKGIAVLGGTFDPVHVGHLRSAIEVREKLRVEKVKLIPSWQPPHRDTPGASPEQRLEMLRRCTGGIAFLEVDDREVQRGGMSYSIDTLKSIRAELYDDVPLTMVLGFDAFQLLDEWHEWQRLLEYAHIAVISRPGADEGALRKELTDFSQGKLVDSPMCLHNRGNGMMCRLTLTQLAVSSSEVREIFRTGGSPDYIVPGEVITYVHENGLYGVTS
jgi:nicotinate-nucleotide adenylyltransferase